jgi:hypothetical protein
MRNTNKALGITIKSNRLPPVQPTSYLTIAGRLAFEMMSFIQPSQSSRFCPPFELVIVGNHGAVVFKCKVRADWKVSSCGSVHLVRRSHFPATALLTDRSLLTRTFLIERATYQDPKLGASGR